MRQLALGGALFWAAFTLQAAPAGALRIPFLAFDWAAIALLWFCLRSRPAAAVAVSWAAGWLFEAVSALPPGLSSVTLPCAGFAAASAKRQLRHDAPAALALWVSLLLAILLAVQAAWLAAATPAPGGALLLRWVQGTVGGALASFPVCWGLERLFGRWMEGAGTEVFAR